MTWPKNFIDWIEGDTAYVSIPFTWALPRAYQRCVWWANLGYKVRAGGPAVSLMPGYLKDVADIGGEVDALPRHNAYATLTSRGCPKRCPFCAVPKIEGDLRELPYWEPRPIVCDNNLLACSRRHFDRVIDSLKGIKGVDFNQGLDATLLTPYHAERLAELDLQVVRLAWDWIGLEGQVMRAIDTLTKAGIPHRRIRCYVLIGFNDTPDDALYRLETLKGQGVLPNPQRYQPLHTLRKDSYVAPGWTERKLRDFMRYWSRQNWLKSIPFEEYVARKEVVHGGKANL